MNHHAMASVPSSQRSTSHMRQAYRARDVAQSDGVGWTPWNRSAASVAVRAPVATSPDLGIATRHGRADHHRVTWPVAALALLLLGFVVAYGSVLQSRLETSITEPAPDDRGTED